MNQYKAPVRDIRFVQDELLEYPEHYSCLSHSEELTPDLVNAIVDEGVKFCEQVLAPLNAIGDEQGCLWHPDGVSTPKGFKEAYQQYVAGGWPSLAHNPNYGGQGLPHSLGLTISELLGEANWSWSMYPGLSHGAMDTIETHGTDEQKQTYLTKLISGEWTGTMCLTESHCGTDLGLLKTKANLISDGSYKITGEKIFISSGDHDLTDNIIHIVLARIPGSPSGTKGISLFIVPKYLPDNMDEKNGVHCGSIEHKMGIHGNATCVINFDEATGFLIGEQNKGLNCMFTFMNFARLGTGLQGLAHCEIAMQGSLSYARERLQGRSLTGVKNPKGSADPIINHPDVRRMLLTIKSLTEGNRALIYFTAQCADQVTHQDQQIKDRAEHLMSFLTPIVKAFITETGFEAANLGLQCYGGHGYIREWGMEQNVRDARISLLYEGTTGIQALDLLGRKILLTQGESMKVFTKIIHLFCKKHIKNHQLKTMIEPLQTLNKEWGDMAMMIGMKAMNNRDEVGAAAYDFLMYSGYLCLAYFWARMAEVAQRKLKGNPENSDFYEAKMQTATFYYERILPRTIAHKKIIESGANNLMSVVDKQFNA